jgi:hypothetical protein
MKRNSGGNDRNHPEVSAAWLLSSRIPGLESSGLPVLRPETFLGHLSLSEDVM